MPAFLKKGQKQLDTEESNTSRLVTKIRLVVKSVKVRLKSWKYFDRVLPNTLIPFVGDDISIAAALCDKYLQALRTRKDDDKAIGCKMLHLSRLNNDLQIRVQRNNLDKMRGHWQKIDAADIIFPAMTEEEIRGLAIGVYQRGENCPQSIPTVAVVDDCPQNAVEWIKNVTMKLEIARRTATTISETEIVQYQVLIYICWPKKSSRLKQMCNAIQQRMLGKSPLTHDEESEELNANQPETTTEVSTD
uniref:Uncharacterized protein n=1 Tax=Magallana gigas TaxID=29159 RepID=K1PP86_MAGGI